MIDGKIILSVAAVGGFYLVLVLAFCYTPAMKINNDMTRRALTAFGRWLAEAVMVGFAVWFMFAPHLAGATPARAADVLITDLPPGVVRGGDEAIDLFIDAAPVAATVLRACTYFEATCAFSGDSGFRIGYVCVGDKKTCWRSFLRSVQAAGVGVLVQPAAGGGSFVFSSSGGGFPSGGGAPSAGAAGGAPELGAGETPAPSTAPPPSAGGTPQ